MNDKDFDDLQLTLRDQLEDADRKVTAQQRAALIHTCRQILFREPVDPNKTAETTTTHAH